MELKNKEYIVKDVPVVVYSTQTSEAGRIEVRIENVMDFIQPLLTNGYQVLVDTDGEGIATINYLWSPHKEYGGHTFAEVDEDGALVDNGAVADETTLVVREVGEWVDKAK